jgi:hypothetical protein
MREKLSVFLILALSAGAVAAQETTYRSAIAPVVKSKCLDCHGEQAPERAAFILDGKGFAAKSLGPRMDSYERIIAFVGWPDTGALMRRLDDGTSQHAGGKPGNMYQYLGGTDAERAANLKLFKAWVGEGAWNLNRWKQRGDVPAITKEQLEKVQLKY